MNVYQRFINSEHLMSTVKSIAPESKIPIHPLTKTGTKVSNKKKEAHPETYSTSNIQCEYVNYNLLFVV